MGLKEWMNTLSVKASKEHVTETLFERFVTIIPLPYTASCILLTLGLGIPGYLLTRYLDSYNLAQTFSVAGTVTGSESYWRAIVFYWTIAYGVFMFYLFYFVKYFRRQLVKARTELSPLLIGGEEAFDKDFRIVSSRIGALATTAIIGAFFAPSAYRMILFSLGGFSAAYVVLSQVILYFAGGTGIWLFFSSIWSLRKLAEESMKLKPSWEDTLFGLGSIGSISLALVLVYFGAVMLRGLGMLASGVEYTPMIGNVAFELILMVFGLITFLLTINVFHRKMVEQKESEKSKLLEERRIMQISSVGNKTKTEKNSNCVQRLMLIDLLEKRLDRIRTWPFDTGVLGRMSTILLSATAIMIARIITVALNL